MAKQRKRESLYPKRIAGISFSEQVHAAVHEVCAKHDMSEAQVARGTVAKGLGAYLEEGLYEEIEDAANELGISDADVVYGAIRNGLEEFLYMARGRKRHEQNARRLGRHLAWSEEVLRRVLKDDDELFVSAEEEEGEAVEPAFCPSCGQYIRVGDR